MDALALPSSTFSMFHTKLAERGCMKRNDAGAHDYTASGAEFDLVTSFFVASGSEGATSSGTLGMIRAPADLSRKTRKRRRPH
jgi:hypothetical protein